MLVPVPLLVRRVMSTKESDLPGGECRGGAAAARGGGCLAEGSAAPALFNVDLQHQQQAELVHTEFNKTFLYHTLVLYIIGLGPH